MLMDDEAVLGSDMEARSCFIYFSNLGSGLLIFLGRMSGGKPSKGVVLGCIRLVQFLCVADYEQVEEGLCLKMHLLCVNWTK